jgi:hydroxymethylpyrimidine pyrophosphatase-like HAD family hydrolase
MPSPTSPLASLATLSAERARKIRLIATDVDGTLTRDGALDPRVAASIAELVDHGLELWPISGRPAGELLGLTRYLPGVKRGIAENGLLEIVPDAAPRWIGEPTDVENLRAVGRWLNAEHGAGLELAGDAFCRLGDVAYERDGRDEVELGSLRVLAEGKGVHLVWSNVHVHLAQRLPDKGAGLLTVLAEQGFSGEEVLTIGDAPNDQGLFVRGRFGITVGTADVARRPQDFTALPDFLCEERESSGFLEMLDRVKTLLAQKHG